MMKPLATVPDSFDRISTPEELKQVVEMLIDLDGPRDMSWFPESRTSRSQPELQVLPEDLEICEEPSALSDSAALTTLFSRMHGRTN
jgi:hypothetical protein